MDNRTTNLETKTVPLELKTTPPPDQSTIKETDVNELSETAFHAAARAGDVQQLKALLSGHKIDYFIGHRNNNGDTASHFAARGGHFECLRLLMDNPYGKCYLDHELISCENHNHETPLHELVKKAYIEPVDDATKEKYRDMINEILKIDEKYYGYCLHRCAAKYGLLELMKELAKKVSPVKHVGYPTELPIEDAVCANQPRVVDWLLTEYKHESDQLQLHILLYKAARNNALETVKCLLKAGASIRKFYWSGHVGYNDDAYMYAASGGHLDVLKCLIEADPIQFRSVSLDELVKNALRSRSLDTIKYVLSLVSFDISAIAKRNLDFAAFFGDINILNYFIKEYKPENAVTDKIDFENCLTNAMFSCQLDTIKCLITEYKPSENFLTNLLVESKERLEKDNYCGTKKNLEGIIELLSALVPKPIPNRDAVSASALVSTSGPSLLAAPETKKPEKEKTGSKPFFCCS